MPSGTYGAPLVPLAALLAGASPGAMAEGLGAAPSCPPNMTELPGSLLQGAVHHRDDDKAPCRDHCIDNGWEEGKCGWKRSCSGCVMCLYPCEPKCMANDGWTRDKCGWKGSCAGCIPCEQACEETCAQDWTYAKCQQRECAGCDPCWLPQETSWPFNSSAPLLAIAASKAAWIDATGEFKTDLPRNGGQLQMRAGGSAFLRFNLDEARDAPPGTRPEQTTLVLDSLKPSKKCKLTAELDNRFQVRVLTAEQRELIGDDFELLSGDTLAQVRNLTSLDTSPPSGKLSIFAPGTNTMELSLGELSTEDGPLVLWIIGPDECQRCDCNFGMNDFAPYLKPSLRMWFGPLAVPTPASTDFLPDFSRAGYHHGDEEPPTGGAELGNRSMFFVAVDDFCVEPVDCNVDAEPAIRSALARAEALVRGNDQTQAVVLFSARVYLINVKDQEGEPIRIASSRITLRGAGSPGRTSSTIKMMYVMKNPDPEKLNKNKFKFIIGPGSEKRFLAKVSLDVDANTRSVVLTPKGGGLSPGQWVKLVAKDVNKSSTLGRSLLGDDASYVSPKWTDVNTNLHFEEILQVSHIEEDAVIFEQPILANISAASDVLLYVLDTVHEIGLEGIRFEGSWAGDFVHHRSHMDDSGFSMVLFDGVVHSWVYNCEFVNTNRALVVSNSASITVDASRVSGFRGHQSIKVSASSHVLVKNSEDLAVSDDGELIGTHHSFGSMYWASGNVFHNCSWPAKTAPELHGQQPTFTLFDRCTGGWEMGHHGGAPDAVPSHLRGLILWNLHQLLPGTESTTLPGWMARKEGGGSTWCESGQSNSCVPDVIVKGWYGNLYSGVALPDHSSPMSEGIGWPVKPLSLLMHQRR